jgi:hypothetical protein
MQTPTADVAPVLPTSMTVTMGPCHCRKGYIQGQIGGAGEMALIDIVEIIETLASIPGNRS